MTAEERLERIRASFVRGLRAKVGRLKDGNQTVPSWLTTLLTHAEAGDDEFWEWVESCPINNISIPAFSARVVGSNRDDESLLARAVQKPGPAPEPRGGRSANQGLPSPRTRGGAHDDP